MQWSMIRKGGWKQFAYLMFFFSTFLFRNHFGILCPDIKLLILDIFENIICHSPRAKSYFHEKNHWPWILTFLVRVWHINCIQDHYSGKIEKAKVLNSTKNIYFCKFCKWLARSCYDFLRCTLGITYYFNLARLAGFL